VIRQIPRRVQREAEGAHASTKAGAWAVRAAGPVAIVAAVLVVMHSVAFSGLLSNQHVDVLSMWLPTHCFLGKTLASGHIPAYNPHVMAGTPFAADPQSGWMYLPAMLLYATLPCGAAIRWLIVLQPILAGLGVYSFLRSERLSRVAATTGGLVLALVIADSYIALSLPFAGTLAWTALVLAAAARLVGASTWPRAIGWAVAVAVAWGQVAGAHMAHGLVIATFALTAYLAFRLVSDVRARTRTRNNALVVAVLVLLALPLVNLAVFVPRLVYLPRTTFGLGYSELERRAGVLSGPRFQPTPMLGPASPPTWPLGLTVSPGSYLGAAALVLSFAGVWARGRRGLFLTFASIAGVCYLLSLSGFASLVEPLARSTKLGQFYLHEPNRFRHGMLLSLAVLVGLGAQAWGERRTWRERLLMLAPGAVIFGVLTPFLGIPHRSILLPVLGAGFGLAALALSARRPAAAMLIPAVLAVELVASGLLGQTKDYVLPPPGIERRSLAFPPLRKMTIDVGDYVRPDATAQVLQRRDDGRYFYLLVGGSLRQRGSLQLQSPEFWPLLGNQRAMLFGLEDVDGYNPVQSVRFWSFVRKADPKNIKYNAAFLNRPRSFVRNLLQINWLTSAAVRSPRLRGTLTESVVQEGRWVLYRARAETPRASVMTGWRTVGSPGDALRAVTTNPFHYTSQVVVEPHVGFAEMQRPRGNGTARYAQLGPQAARIEVNAPAPAIVLVRNVYDPGWHATVDGAPATVMPADYVDQGVFVTEGHHVITLSYDDPSIGEGLLGSALALVMFWWVARAIRRSRFDLGPPLAARTGPQPDTR
jgi:hypothetical protein